MKGQANIAGKPLKTDILINVENPAAPRRETRDIFMKRRRGIGTAQYVWTTRRGVETLGNRVSARDVHRSVPWRGIGKARYL